MAQAVPPRVAGFWEHRSGEFASLLQVRVTEASVGEAARSNGEPRRRTALGMIQVELPKGQVRITARIDAQSLRAVIECLLR